MIILPQSAALNRNHPLMRGMLVAGTHPMRPLSSNRQGVTWTYYSGTALPLREVRRGVDGLAFDTTNNRPVSYPNVVIAAPPLSGMVVFACDTTVIANRRLWEVGSSFSTNGVSIRVSNVADGKLVIDAPTTPWASTNAFVADTVYCAAFSLAAEGGTPLAAVDGVQWTGSGTVTGTGTATEPLHVGAGITDGAPQDPLDGLIGAFAAWNRVLTLDELLLVSRNPGILFQTQESMGGKSVLDYYFGWRTSILARN